MGAYFSSMIENSRKSMNELREMVKWQNMMIDVENAKLRDKFSTDKERVKHMQNNIMGWNQLNFILWFVYYFVVLVIFYIFYKNDSMELTKNQKIYIAIALVLFPFLITTVEVLLYNLFSIIISLIKGTPYPKDKNSQPSFSLLDGLPQIYF